MAAVSSIYVVGLDFEIMSSYITQHSRLFRFDRTV
jgi:hypothetical protein